MWRVTRRKSLFVTAAVVLFVAIVALVVRNQVKVYRAHRTQARVIDQRQALFDALEAVAVTNCQLERFGEPHDGGYLMCGNLLADIQVGYSYGIAGYDKWGCDISTKLNVTTHQYDCFNTTAPLCPSGKTVFHAECVGASEKTEDGRRFDSIVHHLEKNGDGSKPIALKIDVEGAEWDSFLAAPDEVFARIDQMAVEFHKVDDPKYLAVVARLKKFFEVAHVHFNNASCVGGLDPFPTWAYEVLFVNKRLAVVDRSRKATGLHPLDAPNNPSFADCQPNRE